MVLISSFDYTLSGTLFAQIIGSNRAGKRARSLFNCISVTNEVKINEQNNPIAKEPLYLQTEFEVIWLLLPKFMAEII